MDCGELREDQWERLKALVPGGRKGKRGPRTDNRRFFNALLWMALGRAMARLACAAWRLPYGQAALLPLDRDGRSGGHVRGAGTRSRFGMADDQLNHRAGASASRRSVPEKRGPHAQGLDRSRGGLSTRPLVLYESGFAPHWCVPRADIEESALIPVEGQTFCPHKGMASYYEIADVRRAAWSYQNAWTEAARISGLVSIEPDKVAVYLDGVQLRLGPGAARY